MFQTPRAATDDRQRGFTLVELMVTLVIASILVIVTLAMFRDTSRLFAVQDQYNDAQGNLRFAVELISNDLRRTGYLGTPDATADPMVCPKPPVGFPPAISVGDGVGLAEVHDAGQNPFIAPDQLDIIGSFTTAQSFVVGAFPVQPTSVLPLADSATGVDYFARRAGTVPGVNLATSSVVDLNVAPTLPSLFSSLFRTNRWATLYGPTGSMMIVQITASNYDAATPNHTVSATGVVQSSGSQICGVPGIRGEGYELAVLDHIRYSIRRGATDSASMVLWREEVGADGTVVASLSAPVLTNVVDFQVWLEYTQTSGASVMPSMAVDNILDDRAATFIGTDAQARIAHVEVSVRSVREDPSLLHIKKTAASDPLLTFDVNGDDNGAAPVITMRTSVELSNLTFRNL